MLIFLHGTTIIKNIKDITDNKRIQIIGISLVSLFILLLITIWGVVIGYATDDLLTDKISIVHINGIPVKIETTTNKIEDACLDSSKKTVTYSINGTSSTFLKKRSSKVYTYVKEKGDSVWYKQDYNYSIDSKGTWSGYAGAGGDSCFCKNEEWEIFAIITTEEAPKYLIEENSFFYEGVKDCSEIVIHTKQKKEFKQKTMSNRINMIFENYKKCSESN